MQEDSVVCFTVFSYLKSDSLQWDYAGNSTGWYFWSMWDKLQAFMCYIYCWSCLCLQVLCEIHPFSLDAKTTLAIYKTHECLKFIPYIFRQPEQTQKCFIGSYKFPSRSRVLFRVKWIPRLFLKLCPCYTEAHTLYIGWIWMVLL